MLPGNEGWAPRAFVKVGQVRFFSWLRQSLERLRERLPQRFKKQEAGPVFDPDLVHPIGAILPMGPRSSLATVAHGPTSPRFLLKRWFDLPPMGRRDLLAGLAGREQLGSDGYLRVVATGEKPGGKGGIACTYCFQEYRPRTLRTYLNELSGDCPLEEGARIARAVGSSLSRMHLLRMVHGGLTPDSIYVETERGPEAGAIFVDPVCFSGMEFGNEAVMTISEVFLGGRSFMPPEGMLGNPPDVLSDQYALGLITYYIFTRKSPHDLEAASTTAKVKGLLMGSVTPPTRFRSELPNRWEAAILRMCSKHRERRYRSVDDFLADVARVL